MKGLKERSKALIPGCQGTDWRVTDTLYRVARILSENIDFYEKTKNIVDIMAQAARADGVALRISDESAGGLKLVAAACASDTTPSPEFIAFGQGLAGRAYQRQTQVVTTDYASHPDSIADLVSPGRASALALPILFDGRAIGVLNFFSRNRQHFYDDRVNLLNVVAWQIGPLIAHSKLHQQVEATDEVARIITSSLDIDQVYEQFAVELKKLVDFDRVAINLLDTANETYTLGYLSGLRIPGRDIGAVRPLAGTISQHLLQTGQAMIRRNIADPIFAADPDNIESGLRSGLALPLASQGRVVATLSLLSKQVGAYGEMEQAIVQRLSRIIAPAGEYTHLYQDLRNSAEELAFGEQIAKIMTSAADIYELYEKFAGEMKRLVGFDRLTVNLIDTDSQTFTPAYIGGTQIEERRVGMILPLEGTVNQFMVNSGRNFLEETFEDHEAITADRSHITKHFQSSISVPLRFKGLIMSTVHLQSKNIGGYGARELAIVQRYADRIAPAIENARLQEETRRRTEETRVIAEIVRIINSSRDIDEVYERFTAAVGKLLDFDRIIIRLVDEDLSHSAISYLSGVEVPGRQNPRSAVAGRHQLEEVIRTREPSLIQSEEEAELGGLSLISLFKGGFRSFLAVPLVVEDSIIGALLIRSRKSHAYTRRHVDLLVQVGNRIAGAIANSQLHEQTRLAEERDRQRSDELRALYEIARILGETGDFQLKAHRVTQKIAEIAECDAAYFRVSNATETGFELVAAASAANPHFSPPRIIPYGKEIIDSGEAVIINDYPADTRAQKQTVSSGIKSISCMPVKAGGQTFGILTVASSETGHFTPERVRLLTAIVDGLGTTLQNSNLAEELRSSSQEIAVVDRVSRILSSTLNIDQVYERFCEEVKTLVDFDRGGINIFNEDQSKLTIAYLSEKTPSVLRKGETFPSEGTISPQLLETRRAMVLDNLEEHPGFWPLEHHLGEGLHSSIVAPLISGETVYGTFFLFSRQTYGFGERERVIVERLAAQITPAVENAQLYAKRVRTEEALRESEARCRAVMETAPDGILTVNAWGIIESFNPAAEGIFGYTFDEIIGRNVNVLMSEPELGMNDGYLSWHTAIDDAYVVGTGREAEGRRKDGTVFPMELSDGIFETGNGKVSTWIIRDITKRKETESQMQETARLASIGELAAGVAHEINNPLTSVQGFAEFVLKEDLAQEVREDIQIILDEAQRASTIVKNLLFFASGKAAEKRYINLNDVLNRALEIKSYDFRVSNIEIVSLFQPDIPKSMLDEHQLVQVFLNILTNADQAIQNSGGRGQIEVCTAFSDDEIEITIKDDGPGIPPESIARIFEPFFTTKEVGQGTGLGLSISYGIIKQHGGDIWAESIEGEGTEFQITLPVVVPREFQVFQMPLMKSNTNTTKHLLVVDDEPLIRDLLRKYLELERYTVDLAEDGQEAWRKLVNMEYDGILLDLRMPGMSGQQLYELMQDNTPDLARKVLFITGDTVSPETRDFLSQTGNPVVTKPFQLDEILRELLALWD